MVVLVYMHRSWKGGMVGWMRGEFAIGDAVDSGNRARVVLPGSSKRSKQRSGGGSGEAKYESSGATGSMTRK